MVNKVILLGRLGRNPQVKTLANGKVVASLSLATNEWYTDRNGQKQESTEWHNLEVWDSYARNAEKYMRTGTLLYIEGKLVTDHYTDQEGREKSKTYIRVLKMVNLDQRPKRQDSNPYQNPLNNDGTNSGEQNDLERFSYDNEDDELPFKSDTGNTEDVSDEFPF